jgi:hypothetical protein
MKSGAATGRSTTTAPPGEPSSTARPGRTCRRRSSNRLSAQTISDFLEVVAEAMRAETFDARVNRVLTWQRSYLDEQGWEEAADAYRETSNRFMEIERNSRIRLLRTGEKGILGTSGMFLFESPLEEPEP